MRYYPLFLNLERKPVLVIGAGAVTEQKLKDLLTCQARVTVVGLASTPGVRRLAKEGRIRWERRHFRNSDLARKALVIVATDDPMLNERISTLARKRKIWVNVVDAPSLCDFIAPAIVRRGDLTLAISTGGASPALAKYTRQRLEKIIGPEYVHLAALLKRYRPQLKALDRRRKEAVLKQIMRPSFLSVIKTQGIGAAKSAFKELFNGKPAV